MQKYALVQLLEAMDEGTEFAASHWPLHATIVSNFAVDWTGTGLLPKLTSLAAAHRPIRAAAGGDTYFGDRRHIQVTLLEQNDALRALHSDIVRLLKSAGAVFDEPHYLDDGYRAHITVQPDKRARQGDVITINAISIIDMFPHADIHRRKLQQTVRLG